MTCSRSIALVGVFAWLSLYSVAAETTSCKCAQGHRSFSGNASPPFTLVFVSRLARPELLEIDAVAVVPLSAK